MPWISNLVHCSSDCGPASPVSGPDPGARAQFEALAQSLASPRSDYLHWYMLYRAKALIEPEIQRMDDMSLALLKRLVTETFPHGVTLRGGSFRSAFCTEKPHSIVHSGDNYRMMGRCKSLQPTGDNP